MSPEVTSAPDVVCVNDASGCIHLAHSTLAKDAPFLYGKCVGPDNVWVQARGTNIEYGYTVAASITEFCRGKGRLSPRAKGILSLALVDNLGWTHALVNPRYPSYDGWLLVDFRRTGGKTKQVILFWEPPS